MPDKPHFLVTAGTTFEPIDDVRHWSNIFTGQTGLDIARALLDLGDVTLLTSNRAHAAANDGYYGKQGMLGIETFRSHADLRQLLHERITAGPVHAVMMTAAVSDYRPAGVFRLLHREPRPDGVETWTVQNVQARKIKSTHGAIAILGEATEKLVDLFRAHWNYPGLLVKFKLEVGLSEEDLLTIARLSRKASGANYIVANTIEMVHGPHPAAYILSDSLQERVPRPDLAPRLRDLTAAFLNHRA